jgi:hypothetical protein
VGLYIHSPIRLHGAVLNTLGTGKTLPFLLLIYFSIMVIIGLMVTRMTVAIFLLLRSLYFEGGATVDSISQNFVRSPCCYN